MSKLKLWLVVRVLLCLVLNAHASAFEATADSELEEGMRSALQSPLNRSDRNYFCMKFGQISRNQLPGFIVELEAIPEGIDHYLQVPTCPLGGHVDIEKAPLLQSLVDVPISREHFLDVVFKYYTIKRKDPNAWQAVINAKDFRGATILDYIESRFRDGRFTQPETIDAVNQIKGFVCAHGGLYAKYREMKCSTP